MVVNYIHVEAARSEDAETVNFEKERAIENRLDGENGRVEAFDVADLQDS